MSWPDEAARDARWLTLHATGVGKVLLAHAEPTFIQEVIERGLSSITPHTIVSPALLMRALEDVRVKGYGFSAEELTLGTVSVTAPIRDATGHVVAALSLVGRSNRADLARLAPAR